MTAGGALPDSLAAAVRRHAAAHPAAPWLFERRGWDWVWISWQEAADRIAEPAQPSEPAELGAQALLRHLRLQARSPLSDADFQAAAALADRLGASQIRDVLVSKGLLTDPVERRLLAWATLTGAAVLFEPDPAAYVPTAAWARPTLFQGTAGEIAALRLAAQAYRAPWPPWSRKPRPGRPFGRLRVLLPLAALSPEDAAFWTERGVRIVDPDPSRTAASPPVPMV